MCAVRLILMALCLGAAAAHGAPALTLVVESIQHPQFSLSGIRAHMATLGGGAAEVEVGELRVAGQRYTDLRLRCASLSLTAAGIDCPRGELVSAGALPLRAGVRFGYKPATQALDVHIEPSPGESWVLRARGSGPRRTLEVELGSARAQRLAHIVPALATFGVQAQVSGKATLNLAPRGRSLDAELDVERGAFADASGSHAGDKLAFRARLKVRESGRRWRWNADLAWTAGEVFWQPWYWSDRPLRIAAEGTLDESVVRIAHADVAIAGVGAAAVSATLARNDGSLHEASFDAQRIDLATAAPLFVAPLLEQAALPKLTASGTLAASGRFANGELRELDLRLSDVALAEASGRYGVRQVSGEVPWRAAAATRGELQVGAANFGRLPLGPFALRPELNGLGVALARVDIPVLDGRLMLEDVRAAKTAHGWRGQMSGALQPVSMAKVTEVLQLPRMPGIVSASIPRITHERSTLKLDGALVIQVFDGFVSATDLRIVEPFGRAPRLQMDAEVRHIDLGQLTEAFSFGSITGFIDGDIKGLEMANWQPQRFDAFIMSSPGSYRKRISQRAVQNISALGGAGAAAAIQRSLLRIFDEFGYDKLGLSCVLRDGVCIMGGVEDAAPGYVIVKGGWVPAINVIGYNRRVDWEELLSRLQRVTASNAQPIIE